MFLKHRAVQMYLGIEIGGTKLQAGLGDGQGSLVRIERVRAEPRAGRPGICRQIAELVKRFANERAKILRVGIGFGGPVSSAAGVVCKSHQVAGWEDFPLVDWFRDQLDLDAVLGNDSDLGGLAEACFGAGRGASPVVYMNIGSGIGGALIIDGQLYNGQGQGAMEIGHLRISPAETGVPWRTVESLCSGWGLAEAARSLAEAEPTGLLRSLADERSGPVTTEVLCQAVRQKDPSAQKIWDEAIERLAVAIANVITLLAPQCFVLGGGVALVGDLLLEPLRAQVARQVFAPFADSYRIVPAGLGEDMVLHGALKLAHDSK